MSGIGIPCKLMHEAEGHIVTIELKSGETYRGKLIEVNLLPLFLIFRQRIT